MQELHHGFQNTLAWDLLTHAIAQCLIDPFMIYQNKPRLKESLDNSPPFVDLVERASEVQYFALDAGQPSDDGEIMTEV